MTYHVIKVMAVEVPGFKELLSDIQDFQEQKGVHLTSWISIQNFKC